MYVTDFPYENYDIRGPNPGKLNFTIFLNWMEYLIIEGKVETSTLKSPIRSLTLNDFLANSEQVLNSLF